MAVSQITSIKVHLKVATATSTASSPCDYFHPNAVGSCRRRTRLYPEWHLLIHVGVFSQALIKQISERRPFTVRYIPAGGYIITARIIQEVRKRKTLEAAQLSGN